MSGLRREAGFGARGDDLYAALVEAQDGLDNAQSLALNARLVLLLANQVGDLAVVQEAIAAARASLMEEGRANPSPQRGEGPPSGIDPRVEQPAAAGVPVRGSGPSG